MPRKLSVVAAALGDDIRSVVRLARIAGFAGVQLDVYIGSLDLTTLSQSGQRELTAVIRSSDQELSGIRADLGAKGLSRGADIDSTLDHVEKILEAAAGLRCPLIC